MATTTLGNLDDARHELVLTARLVTVVMTGVMLGVEHGETGINLGVSYVKFIRVSAALTGVLVTRVEGALRMPAFPDVTAMVGGLSVGMGF